MSPNLPSPEELIRKLQDTPPTPPSGGGGGNGSGVSARATSVANAQVAHERTSGGTAGGAQRLHSNWMQTH